MNRFYLFLDRVSNGRRAAFLLVCAVAVLATVNLFDFPLSVPYMQRVSGNTYLDMQGFYTSERAYRLLDAFGPEGRRLQLGLLPTIDVVLPLVMAMFGTVTITFLFRSAFGQRSRSLRLAALPLLALVADYLENTGIMILVATYPERHDDVAQAAGVFTAVKSLAYAATVVVLLVGSVLALWRAWSRLAAVEVGDQGRRPR